MEADVKPAKTAPKIVDVAKPAGTQATSRPIIVGHGAVIRDPMMSPASSGAATSLKSAVKTETPMQAVDDAAVPDETGSIAEPTTAPEVSEAVGTGDSEDSKGEIEVPAEREEVADDSDSATSEEPTAEFPKITLNPKPQTSSSSVAQPAVTKPAQNATTQDPARSVPAGSVAGAKSVPSKTVSIGRKIEPTTNLSVADKKSDTKLGSTQAEDDLHLPDDKLKDPSKEDAVAVDMIGNITVERMQELKNGKEYKIELKGHHTTGVSWTAVLLLILLAGVGVLIAIDAGWIDIGIELPFDLIT